MKIAFKNFLTTLRRYRTASVLNIAGLTLAFLAFYVIMAQVTYDLGYNRSFPAAGRLYAVLPNWFDDEYSLTSPRPAFEAAVVQCPEVEQSGMMMWGRPESVWAQRSDYDFDRFEFPFGRITLSMLDLLGFRAAGGDLEGISSPDGVIVARSVAERMNIRAGDSIYTAGEQSGDKPSPSRRWTVAGIYDDFADNSMLSDGRIFGIVGDEGVGRPNDYLFTCLFRLREGASPDRFIDTWKRECFERSVAFSRDWAASAGRTFKEDNLDRFRVDATAEPLHDLYFDSRIGGIEHGSVSTMLTCAGIAFAVVLIAFINFVNFFFALIPVRLRAVNICKVFGASVRSLRFSFLFEAAGLVVCALLITAWLSPLLSDTPVADYVSRSLSVEDNLAAVGLLLAIGLVMAVAAALYPSYYITSFNASLAARGSFSGSAAGRRMRVALLGVQFAVSMVLITVTACMWLQYRYMMNYDIGIDRDNLFTFRMSDAQAGRYDAISGRMNGIAGISGVTASAEPVVSRGSSLIRNIGYRDQNLSIYMRPVLSNFAAVMGIPVIEGEDLKPEYDNAPTEYALLGDGMRRRYGFELGDVIPGNGVDCRIVGFVRDVLAQPLDEEMNNIVYTTSRYPLNQVYFRVGQGADVKRVVDEVRTVLGEFDPDSDPDIELFDAGLQRLYSRTLRSAVIIGMFALLAVVISLMGVFGIVMFETQHRRREIAVRRVLGAPVAGLVWMFARRYAIIVCVCFAVTVPVSWYIVDGWMRSFVRRYPVSWTVFAVSLVLVAAVTVGLVAWRSCRAASENPSRVLGGE